MTKTNTQMETPVLKIFGAEQWHDDIQIVGNKLALNKLKSAIEKALKGNASSEEMFETDGEGYDIEVVMFNEKFSDTEWDKLPMHYISDLAQYDNAKKWKNLVELFKLKKS